MGTTPDSLGEACARITQALEEDIVLGGLHPRERLVEDDLMARFAAKRHVVRDALAALDRLGLVERRKNVGALVRSFDTKTVEELYQLRTLLETEAARQIPLPVAAPALEALVAIQCEHDAAVRKGDKRQVFRSNLAFHQALFALTGNEVLRQAIIEYARQTHPIRFSSLVSETHRERSRVEHWQLIEALRDGRREELVRLCGDHLAPSRDAYLAMHGMA